MNSPAVTVLPTVIGETLDRIAAGGMGGTKERTELRPGEIATRRLTLRALHESDREEMCRVLETSREHLRDWIPFQGRGESTSMAFDRALYLSRNGDQTRTAWRRVGVSPSGRIVGGCAIYAMLRGLSMEACIHWWVSADAVGRGFGLEIVCASVEYAVADLPDGLGMHKLCASIHPMNAASVALAVRAGFVRAGRSRHPVQVGDRWERMDEYEFTASIPDDAPGYSGSAGGVERAGVPVPSIPGRGCSVPSRATRS